MTDIDPLDISMCTDCGSLVMDVDIHREWHSNISAAMQSAYRADMWTRPIG